MPEAKEEAPRRFLWSRFLLFIAIVLVVVFFALYSFFSINPFDVVRNGFGGVYQQMVQTVDEANRKVVDIYSGDAGEAVSYCALPGGIAVCSPSTLRFFREDGIQEWYVPVTLKKPFIRTIERDILVADLGGRFFGLVRDGKMLWSDTLNVDIVNASIVENWIFIVTESRQTGYKRTIHAYSRDGQEVAYRSVSDYYPIMIWNYSQYNPSMFIVCGVEAQGLGAVSLFEFLDLSMNQKGSIRAANADEVFTGAIPLAGGKLLLSGSKSLICVDKALATLWKIDLGGDFLSALATTRSGTTVAAVLNGEVLGREKRQKTAIRMINSQGDIIRSIDVDAAVSGIRTAGGTIACVAGSEVYFMNEQGEIIDKYSSHYDVDDICLPQEDLAYVIGGGKAVGVRLNVDKKFLGIF
jgi:hypothetical protein